MGCRHTALTVADNKYRQTASTVTMKVALGSIMLYLYTHFTNSCS